MITGFTGPSTSKAIETIYPWPDGNRYRSRLEARWAVFFETLGIPYEYEKEGYDLSHLIGPTFGWTDSSAPGEDAEEIYQSWRVDVGRTSALYLPDFWLPHLNCWIEIKGQEPSRRESALADMLAFHTNSPLYLFYGEMRGPEGWNRVGPPAYKIYGGSGGDHPYFWCECGTCGFMGIEFDARSDRLDCKESYDRTVAGCPRMDGDKGYTGDSPRLMAAYAAARQARFEYGEHGR